MVASTLFALLAASASTLLVRADVTPSAPGPGSVFKEGDNCQITWKGDADSKTVWKDMSIELMTGDNFNMVHLTTVANNQDGTVDGQFQYPCPEVTPNAAIYFYQFSTANTPNLTWTTRFTIAGADGSTTEPTESTQPGTNAAIPWGTGALKDPSKATPPPSFAAAGPGSSSSVSPSGPLFSSTSSGPAITPSSSTSARSTMTTSRAGSTAGAGAPPAGQTGAPNSSNNNTSSGDNSNAALGSVKLNRAVAVLVGSALTFAFFL